MKTRVQHDLLGAVLQRHTKALLEGEDLLQVPTQGGAVWTAQSEHIDNSYFIINGCNSGKLQLGILTFSLYQVTKKMILLLLLVTGLQRSQVTAQDCLQFFDKLPLMFHDVLHHL